MHLERNEQCIEFLNDTKSHPNLTTAVEYTLDSFAHRVYYEQRGFLAAAEHPQLDPQSISILDQ